jgi:hypothetical protein
LSDLPGFFEIGFIAENINEHLFASLFFDVFDPSL